MWRVNEHVRYLIEQLPELGGSQRLLIGYLAEDGSVNAQQRATDLLRPQAGVAKARKAKPEEIQRLSEALLHLTGLSFPTV